MPIPTKQDFIRFNDEELLARFTPDEMAQAANSFEEEEAKQRPGFVDRAAASFATTPEGEARIYRDRGFDANVRDEKVFTRSDVGELQADPEGFDVGDIADMAGPAIPGLLATLGGVAGMPGGFLGSAGLASAGGVIGESFRQGAGKLLGSEEKPNYGNLATEAALGPLGEGVGRLGLRALAPFKGAVTERISQVPALAGALDKRFGTQVKQKLPLSAQTENRTLQEIEQRVAELPGSADKFEQGVTLPFEQEVSKLFEKIRGKVGPAPGREGAGESAFRAAGDALTKRKEVVSQAYDALKAKVPADTPVVPTQSLETISAMISDLQGAEKFTLTAPQVDRLKALADDVENIQTFQDLDVYRRSLGAMLDDRGAREEFSRVGLDAKIGAIYKALVQDGDAALSAAIGTEGTGALQAAKGLAKSQFELQDASVNRLLRDPDQAANIVPSIMSSRFTPQQVTRLKERLGTVATEAGLPDTEMGGEAWKRVQAEVLEQLREKALNRNTQTSVREAFSGTKLISAIDQIGGREKLNALFGADMGRDIFDFATLLRDSNVGERSFANTSRTGRSVAFIEGMMELFRRPFVVLGAATLAKGAGKALTTPGGRKYLTEGVLQDGTSQKFLSVLGRAVPQGALRGVTNN